MDTTGSPVELEPMIGQDEQLDQVNAKPMSGFNRKPPRCVTPGCPCHDKCKCPSNEGPERDYSKNLQDNDFCGYFKSKEDVWKPSN